MPQPPDTPSRATRFARRLPAVLVFGLLVAYSAVQAPVPAVNEPQYLGKAKHGWNPGWCPRDFFLDSSNPHLFFYLAVGWLTRFCSLEVTAWIARVAGYALLAVGWTALAKRITGSSWAAVLSAALFLLHASLGGVSWPQTAVFLPSFGSLSGEWLVGGIEGKVFAYALLFLAIAFRLGGRWNVAAACLGGSVSFHPIVGVWGLICGGAAEGALRLAHSRSGRVPNPLTACAVLFIAALPGLIPAAATLGGSDARSAARATYMQVFIRLRHHLDPTQFAPARYAGYAVLLAALTALFIRSVRRFENSRDAEAFADRWLASFVQAAVVVALAGVAIGWHSGDAWTMPLRDLRGTLLKFYPFRLADVFVPFALSLALARQLVSRRSPSPAGAVGRPLRLLSRIPLAASLLTFAAFAASLAIPSPDRNPSRMPAAQLAAWKDVAGWVRHNTPADALIVSPSRQWGFRWYADRAEFVNYKDVPQDTPGLLEWERRLDLVKRWWESSPNGRFSAADLQRLGEQTDAEFLVTIAFAERFAMPPVYDNGTYRVYRLSM